MDVKELKRLFAEPPSEFGPTPFWAINTDMKPETIGASLRDLKAKGVSGVIIHPRTGFEVEYMSPEFWTGMDYIVETLESFGMKGWLYDEYNWPSGVVAGRLIRERPDFKQRGLAYLFVERGMGVELNGPMIAAFDVDHHYQQLIGQEGLKTYIPPEDVRRSLVFYEDPMVEATFATTCAPWTGEEVGMIDYMNAEAVDRFIELTHEEYARRYSKHFGKTIVGLFTDEPQNHHGLMWTRDLFAEFEERCGYDLKPILYRLVAETDKSAATRKDYYRIASSLYKERYFDRVGKWCEEHGLIFTGHLSQEDSPATLPANHGSLFMPLSGMQMPGTDWLGIGYGMSGRATLAQASNMNPKVLSSVAHLMKRERTLVEIWGGGGWHASPRTMKPSLDWLFALGVNFINPHLVLVGIKGHRKRDFPPTFTKVSPWWEKAADFSKYIARLSWLLSRGEHQAKTLLLFPTVSMWAMHKGRGDRPADYEACIKALTTATDALIAAHYEYDYMFEEALDKYLIVRGRIVAGNGVYDTVVVPPTAHLDEATAEWLDRAKSAGIKVIGHQTIGEMLSTLELLSPSNVSIEGDRPEKIVVHRRKISGTDVVFMANISRRANRVIIGIGGVAGSSVEEWNPDDGSMTPLKNIKGSGDVSFDFTFDGGASRVFVCSPGLGAGGTISFEKPKVTSLELRDFVGEPVEKNLYLVEPWNVETKRREIRSFNRMRRDRRYSTRTKMLLAVGKPIIAALNPILKPEKHYRFERFFAFGEGERLKPIVEKILGVNFDKMALYEAMEYISSMIEYVAVRTISGVQFPQPGEKYTMTAFFDIADKIPDLEVIYEDVGEPVTITINDKATPIRQNADVWDVCNRAINIAELVREGRNEIRIESTLPATPAKYPCLHTLEPVVLRGDFVVTKNGLKSGKASVPGGASWTRHGLPHYNDEVVYKGTVAVVKKPARATLDLGVVRETAEVFVNGMNAGVRLWQPYTFDVKDLLKIGENAIEVRVRATPANLFAKPRPSGILGRVKLKVEE